VNRQRFDLWRFTHFQGWLLSNPEVYDQLQKAEAARIEIILTASAFCFDSF